VQGKTAKGRAKRGTGNDASNGTAKPVAEAAAGASRRKLHL